MSVTAIRNEAGCVEVRWSLPALLLSMPPRPGRLSRPSYFYLVSVASSDNAAGREWMVVVRNSSTTELQLNLAQSQLVGTPLVTVRRCCVTKSELGERWSVEQVMSSAEDDACRGGGTRLTIRLKRMSLGRLIYIPFSCAVCLLVTLVTEL